MKKKYVIWSVVVLAVLTLGFVFARADAVRHGWCHHHGPFGLIAHELKLSNAQKAQVKTIWQGEKPTVASLVRELAAENKEMATATAQGSFDASKVQPIADRQAATIAKLLMEKEKIRTQVYTNVLNPDQRAKADKLQQRWQGRFDRIADRIEQGGHAPE